MLSPPRLRSAPGAGGSGGVKPLREQVSRACDQCRARRIKCSEQRPCRGCIQRGVSCAVKGSEKPASYPLALREIETLQNRVKQLETELQACQVSVSTRQAIPTPSDSTTESSPGAADITATLSTPSPTVTTQDSIRRSSLQWEGIYVATPCSERRYYYGPSSSFYFISRIGAHLAKAQQPIAERSMQPYGATKTIADPANLEHDMSRTQEEYFLGLFWESYHVMLPVVNEGDFRRHYESLWQGDGSRRKASPLVDIVLALCLQYGYSFLPRTADSHHGTEQESTMAGRRFYKRCQALLVAELETPSLVTVQCQIFSVVYLCCASFQNMAHILLATLARTAQIIGLHLEPPLDMPEAERELRKRVWWTIATIETKTHMKLGRPTLIDLNEVTVSYPKSDVETAKLSGSQLGAFGSDVTWLSYSCHLSSLVRTTAAVHHEAWGQYGSIMSQKKLVMPYQSPQTLEACAEKLAQMMAPLKTWADDVPEGLRLGRRDGGRPFTTACLPVDFDTFAPNWLQKNRVVLELTYHTMLLNLYRPFITFSSSTVYTPNASRHATAAVQHAMAHTHIMHQAVSETDLMCGWSEFFLWQWNATITIIGFILANPVHPSTPNARKMADKCIGICDMYGVNIAVAKSAASIARDLVDRADALTARLRSDVTGGGGVDGVQDVEGSAGSMMSRDEEQTEVFQDPGSWEDFMDWALTVDTFNSFESFYGSATGDMDNWWNTRS